MTTSTIENTRGTKHTAKIKDFDLQQDLLVHYYEDSTFKEILDNLVKEGKVKEADNPSLWSPNLRRFENDEICHKLTNINGSRVYTLSEVPVVTLRRNVSARGLKYTTFIMDYDTKKRVSVGYYKDSTIGEVLDNLVKDGIIETSDSASIWHGIHRVFKKDEICSELRNINEIDEVYEINKVTGVTLRRNVDDSERIYLVSQVLSFGEKLLHVFTTNEKASFYCNKFNQDNPGCRSIVTQLKFYRANRKVQPKEHVYLVCEQKVSSDNGTLLRVVCCCETLMDVNNYVEKLPKVDSVTYVAKEIKFLF